MRLLVLGGTGFVGRQIVERALARGDEVTLFNRGLTAPELFPAAELLRGDRAGDLRALRDGGPWDAAIDVTGYRPEDVAASSQALAGRVEHLTFISTISVYDDVSQPGVEEDAPLAPLSGRGGWEDYGALKALCEQAVHEATSSPPTRALIVRPGIVAGPYDPTNRFSAWVARMARGGRVLAPGARQRPLQLIDARDLAAFVLDMTAARATGAFNAVGAQLTWGEMLAACVVPGSQTELVWVADERLRAAGIAEEDLPLWIAADDADNAGFMQISGARAVAAGLRHRPLAQTARDVLAALRPEDELALDRALEARLVG
jgi:2'-hydroxyisoflavone reductase